MRRRMNVWSSAAAREEGIALVTVMIVVMVMMLLATVAVNSLSSEFTQLRRELSITDSRSAADAGVDKLVFVLQQGSNWTGYQTSYNTATGGWWKDATLTSTSPCY